MLNSTIPRSSAAGFFIPNTNYKGRSILAVCAFLFISISTCNYAAAQNCTDISGSWIGSQTGSLTCTSGGESATSPTTNASITTIVINQNGCNVDYDVFVDEDVVHRTGTVRGNDVSFSGIFAIPQPGCSATKNNVTIQGIIEGSTMSLSTSSEVKATCDDSLSVSCTGMSFGTWFRTGFNITVESEIDHVWANGHETTEVTVFLSDDFSADVAGRAVRLTADRIDGISIEPDDGVLLTNSDGVARFRVRSTQLGKVVFTASIIESPSGTDSTSITFVQRKVAVFVQGINTKLKSKNAHETFLAIRTRLVDDLGFARPIEGALGESGAECSNAIDDDQDGVANDGCPLILNYSYKGGQVNLDTGIWLPEKYKKRDTSLAFDFSILHLLFLLKEFAQENPNTSFIVIGHSQGGFIALQSLQLLFGDNGVTLDTVITLDGALGGAPRFSSVVTSVFSKWGDPASSDMIKLWESAGDENHKKNQGTAACFVTDEDDVCILDNASLVARAHERGVKIVTIGSKDDCVWNHKKCGIRDLNGRDFPSNKSTQIILTADFQKLMKLGGNCPLSNIPGAVFTAACLSFITPSHSIVLDDPRVMEVIEQFVGASIVPHAAVPSTVPMIQWTAVGLQDMHLRVEDLAIAELPGGGGIGGTRWNHGFASGIRSD